MHQAHIAITVILLVNLLLLIFILSREDKCLDKNDGQKDGYPGPGKCVGPGPKMGASEPCCNPGNDLYNGNPDKKQCDYDGWGFEYKNNCIGYGRTRADCKENCQGDPDCVKNCPINYQDWAPASCANRPDE